MYRRWISLAFGLGVVIAMVVVVVLVDSYTRGISSGSTPAASASASASAPSSSPAPRSTAPTSPGSPRPDDEVCPTAPTGGGPTPAAVPYTPLGPAYAGPGPHYPYVVARTNQLRNGEPMPGPGEDESDTNPPEQDYNTQDAFYFTNGYWGRPQGGAPSQLVVCVYLASVEKTNLTCAYDGGVKLMLLTGTFDVVVREAKTARVLGSFSLTGQQPSLSRDCPLSVLPQASVVYRVITPITVDAYAHKIRAFVTANV